MNKAAKPRSAGRYESTPVAGETVEAFVPYGLPPKRPKLTIVGKLATQLQAAESALDRLEAAGRIVPSLDWFVYSFVRKEAVISSQIEGTQASLVDLLAAEADVKTRALPEHVEEISNYLVALTYARGQLKRERGLPLSIRLLNGAHRRLLSGTRGQDRQPGKIRNSQNWIGGTRPGNAHFVPPPPHRVPELLAQLEQFLHGERHLPALVRVGLVHAQFETIHPYLDGNGRVGRLLIALCLEDWKLLSEPLLYLSLFFKQHQRAYYERLDAIRASGDWEGWLEYFLEGVAEVADGAVQLIGALFDRLERDRKHYIASDEATVTGARLFEQLPAHPVLTVNFAVRLCQTTRPTATKAINSLCDAKILEESTGRKRDRAFTYRSYLDLLTVGTELSG